MLAQDYQAFVARVKDLSGIDLGLYKEAQMKRRLVSLRDQNGCTDFNSFYKKLTENETLFDRFLDRMTINVSGFYRNQKRWDILRGIILPPLLKQKRRLKIWSAACSTGEEPYTLAIILSELGALEQAHILATDLDRNVLEKAKAGVYRDQSLQELPALLKQDYFEAGAGGFQIDPLIKRAVTFKQHNLLAHSYPESIDLIVCRNVCIYFTDEAKQTLYKKFNQSLSNGGILFVGSTEQIFNPENFGFCTEDTFFYRKTSSISHSEQEAMI